MEWRIEQYSQENFDKRIWHNANIILYAYWNSHNSIQTSNQKNRPTKGKIYSLEIEENR